MMPFHKPHLLLEEAVSMHFAPAGRRREHLPSQEHPHLLRYLLCAASGIAAGGLAHYSYSHHSRSVLDGHAQFDALKQSGLAWLTSNAAMVTVQLVVPFPAPSQDSPEAQLYQRLKVRVQDDASKVIVNSMKIFNAGFVAGYAASYILERFS